MSEEMVQFLRDLGLPVTRENYIAAATFGIPGYEWTEEDEQDMPPELREDAQPQLSLEPADEADREPDRQAEGPPARST